MITVNCGEGCFGKAAVWKYLLAPSWAPGKTEVKGQSCGSSRLQFTPGWRLIEGEGGGAAATGRMETRKRFVKIRTMKTRRNVKNQTSLALLKQMKVGGVVLKSGGRLRMEVIGEVVCVHYLCLRFSREGGRAAARTYHSRCPVTPLVARAAGSPPLSWLSGRWQTLACSHHLAASSPACSPPGLPPHWLPLQVVFQHHLFCPSLIAGHLILKNSPFLSGRSFTASITHATCSVL